MRLKFLVHCPYKKVIDLHIAFLGYYTSMMQSGIPEAVFNDPTTVTETATPPKWTHYYAAKAITEPMLA